MSDISVEVGIEASQNTGAIDAAASAVENLGHKTQDAGDKAAASSDKFGAVSDAAKGLEERLAEFASATAIFEFFKHAIEEANKEAEAMRTLKFTVESTGQSWGEAKERIEAFAQAQEATTRFGQAETLTTLSQLARITGEVGAAMKATALAEDIASASGKSIGETTQTLTLLLAGNQRAVLMANREFGAFTDGATTAQGVLDALQKHFTGAAEQEDSFAKTTAQARNALEDFSKQVGQGVMPVVQALGAAVTFLIKGFEDFGVAVAATAAGAVTAITGLSNAFIALISGNFGEAKNLALQTKNQLIQIAEDTQADIAKIEARYSHQRVEQAKNTSKLVARVKQEEVQDAEDFGFEMAAINGEIATKKEQEDIKAARAKSALTAREIAESKQAAQFITALEKNKNAELRDIGKAAAASKATVQTYLAANEAYAAMAPIPFIGPALGASAAAAAIVAGLANVQQIVAAEEGAFLPGSGFGQIIRAGENNKSEAILPLDDARAMEKIRAALGGGSSGAVLNFYNTFTLPGIDGLRDPRVIRDVLDAFADELQRQSPEAILVALRTIQVARVNNGRAA